jgi:predicted nucleic acid-binding protein
MKIVSNTGPIIALAKIGKLGLLKEIAPEVLIPLTVYRELFAKVGRESQVIDQALADFMGVTEVKEIDPVITIAIAGLDEGEKQAIALASTFSEKLVLLLDDRAGRRVAQKLGFSTTGSIGVLLRLKEKGAIENVGLLLSEMRDRGYWLDDKVIEVAKRLAGEND